MADTRPYLFAAVALPIGAAVNVFFAFKRFIVSQFASPDITYEESALKALMRPEVKGDLAYACWAFLGAVAISVMIALFVRSRLPKKPSPVR